MDRPQYTFPAPLVQAVVATLNQMPAHAVRGILNDIEAHCVRQDGEHAEVVAAALAAHLSKETSP